MKPMPTLTASPLTRQMDVRLLPFLQAETEGETARLLERLINQYARPVLRRVLRRKLGADAWWGRSGFQRREELDLEDLEGEVVARLIEKLHEVKAGPNRDGIRTFTAYVAIAAAHAVYRHLRQKYAWRSHLEKRLRYQFTHQRELALWRDAHGEWLCGSAIWRFRRPPQAPGRLWALLDDPQGTLQIACLPATGPERLTSLLIPLSRWLDQPVPLNDLIRVLGNLWPASSEPAVALEVDGWFPGAHAFGQDTSTLLLRRLEIDRCWAAIRRLKPLQRVALLLQGQDPDGNSLVELLITNHVATESEIADAIRLSRGRLYYLRPALPLEDRQIAVRLQVSAQHVARLRMLARRQVAAQLRLNADHNP